MAKRAMALDGVPVFEPVAEPLKVAPGSWLEKQILQAKAEMAKQKLNDPTRVTCGCGIAAEQHHLPVVARWHASWRKQA